MKTIRKAVQGSRRLADCEIARRQMVEQQLRRRGITDEKVLQAMSEVPREEFIADNLRDNAYDDCPLPIGFGQTISQPFTVAFQCQALYLQGSERVLEIGTGSGYAAAVLSQLAKEVYTVERIPGLATDAKETLRHLGYVNVHVFAANGTLGLPDHAPFDGIVVTAGGTSLPKPFLEQLTMGGRIVMPIGEGLYGQSMYRFTKQPDELKVENLGGFAFVPLIGRYGWSEHSQPTPRAPVHQHPAMRSQSLPDFVSFAVSQPTQHGSRQHS
jgi:protein-L-isoaspartate(D-aspartate) O-methyltransferase